LLGQVLGLVGIGVALGLGGAAALTRFMESLLFGVRALDLETYALGAVALLAAAALAAYLPARRATRVDPMEALKAE
jgi:ABC-type antimicrobial peptide transport system permease subunit